MNGSPTLLKCICVCSLFLLAFGSLLVDAQNRAPKIVSQPLFTLSDDAIAAGIDGVLGVTLKIDKTGKVQNVFINGGPAWPCSASEPKDQIEAVRDAVKKQLLATTFEPTMKAGKAIDVELSLQFKPRESAKTSPRDAMDDLETGVKPINAGVINGRAIKLVRPTPVPMNGVVIVHVLIDEQGNVIHAGAVTGPPQLQNNARTAACASKFSPTSLDGKPVKVTGMINYAFSF